MRSLSFAAIPMNALANRDVLDEVCKVFLELWDLAHENPQALHDAPTKTPVRRLDEVGAARNPVLRYTKG